MYFILIYLTEHITPKEQSFGVVKGLVVGIDRKSVYRPAVGEYERKPS